MKPLRERVKDWPMDELFKNITNSACWWEIVNRLQAKSQNKLSQSWDCHDPVTCKHEAHPLDCHSDKDRKD